MGTANSKHVWKFPAFHCSAPFCLLPLSACLDLFSKSVGICWLSKKRIVKVRNAWTHAVLGVLYACVLHFCICTCSGRPSMFQMERHSTSTITVIIIKSPPPPTPKQWTVPVPAYWVTRCNTTNSLTILLVVKASASRAEGPGFESRLRRDFFGVESYQWLQNWHSSGYPARRLAL